MESIIVPPYAPTLMESTRAIGYSLEAASADIIDNSIAAGASEMQVYFFPVGQEYVAFLDNGIGMSEAEIDIAMQYGSRNPLDDRASNDLGRFGLGLKTASLSQCEVLTVISKQNDNICARRWDLNYVVETGNWSLLILNKNEINECPHFMDLEKLKSGTLVIWQKLDRLKSGEVNFEEALGRKMDLVKEHLSLVFHRYLSGEPGIKKLSININGQQLEPTDPFLITKSAQAIDDEVIVVKGKKIIVRPYILPHISKMNKTEIEKLGGKDGLRRQQGFYIYRNKRLLVWGTWFRMMRQGEMSKLVRIRVDIPNDLDNLWTLDIKKSSAIPPAEVRMNLRNIVDKMAEKSKRTWTTRGKIEGDTKVTHVWNRIRTRNGGFIYEINREYPLFKEFASKNNDNKAVLEMFCKQIEENMPLNSLYLDLTNDEKIENDTLSKKTEVFEMAKNILRTMSDENREDMLKSLAHSEPFNLYSKELLTAYEKGTLL